MATWKSSRHPALADTGLNPLEVESCGKAVVGLEASGTRVVVVKAEGMSFILTVLWTRMGEHCGVDQSLNSAATEPSSARRTRLRHMRSPEAVMANRLVHGHEFVFPVMHHTGYDSSNIISLDLLLAS